MFEGESKTELSVRDPAQKQLKDNGDEAVTAGVYGQIEAYKLRMVRTDQIEQPGVL